MIPYEGWDREYRENKEDYLNLFDKFMSQTNYENPEWFEKKFADYIGRKHAVSVASATDALYFSLLVHGIGPGDEVLVTDFSWISTSSCISMTGATPIFCDIDLDSYHINLDSIKRMYGPRVKALIYTHLFGNMTDTTEIEQFCKQNDIALIEDAAQSLGSSLNGRKAGTIGGSSSFSFNTNKVIAGINGGGMYLTDDTDHADYVKKLRRHGKGKDFEFLGFNSRMYTLNAEIINLRMQSMIKNQKKRQEIAQQYIESLSDTPLIVQEPCAGLDHNYHKFVIRCEDKEKRKKLKNILSASIHYETALSDNSMYDLQHIRKDECENAKLAADTVMSLPIHAWLKQNEISNVIAIIRSFYSM
jgi:UDP-2-acetamido-2-deoxy-ribo-hexuluronate aminotransferase